MQYTVYCIWALPDVKINEHCLYDCYKFNCNLINSIVSNNNIHMLEKYKSILQKSVKTYCFVHLEYKFYFKININCVSNTGRTYSWIFNELSTCSIQEYHELVYRRTIKISAFKIGTHVANKCNVIII